MGITVLPGASISNIPEVTRIQLSLPSCPHVIRVAGVGCLKAPRSQDLHVHTSLERRVIRSPGMAPAFLICYCPPRSTSSTVAPLDKPRPRWVGSRACTAPSFVSRQHALVFIRALKVSPLQLVSPHLSCSTRAICCGERTLCRQCL